MKTLFRICIILLACLVVSGITYAIGRSSGNQAAPRFERPRNERAVQAQGENQAGDNATANGEQRPFRERREGGGRGRGMDLSARGWAGFAQTLVPFAVIIAVVSLVNRLVKQRRTTVGVSSPTSP